MGNTGNTDAFTKLPTTENGPPSFESGTVVLYADNNWNSRSWTMSLADWVVGQRHNVAESMFDQATWAAFNLPVGTVVTLMDNVVPVKAGGNVADLSGCGRTVDLVGTGRTESVDLRGVNMNDCVSSFFWREVDLDMGAIELFDDANFAGNRATLFLSEWESGQIYSIGDWWLNDRVSSVRWRSMNDRQTASLFVNADGSGDTFNNISGYAKTKECASLSDFRFNDCASAFRRDGLAPKKEIIAPFDVQAGTGANSFGLTSVVTGTNNSSVVQPVVVTLNNTDAQTVTVATTDTHVVGVKTTFSFKMSEKIGDSGYEATWSIELSYSYTHSETRTQSDTKTVALTVSETVNAPPMTSYKATLLVSIGTIPSALYHTTAQRWYDQPVTGGVQDPTNNNWYKRVEPVTITVDGSLAATTTVRMDATPLSS